MKVLSSIVIVIIAERICVCVLIVTCLWSCPLPSPIPSPRTLPLPAVLCQQLLLRHLMATLGPVLYHLKSTLYSLTLGNEYLLRMTCLWYDVKHACLIILTYWLWFVKDDFNMFGKTDWSCKHLLLKIGLFYEFAEYGLLFWLSVVFFLLTGMTIWSSKILLDCVSKVTKLTRLMLEMHVSIAVKPIAPLCDCTYHYCTAIRSIVTTITVPHFTATW